MGRFCDDLREERERRGISLEAISWSTKIAARHLQALETGDYAELPGGVFRKGFFRSYLGALGLAQAPWMERFAAELQTAGIAEPDGAAYEQLARNISQARAIGPPEARLRWTGVLAMLGLLLAFGWCIWHFAISGRVTVAQSLSPPLRQTASAQRPRASRYFSTSSAAMQPEPAAVIAWR